MTHDAAPVLLSAPGADKGCGPSLPECCAWNQRREHRDCRDEPGVLELRNGTRELNI
jgi:hypothetical protein